MIKAITLTTLAAATALSAFAFTPANAQIDVYVTPAPTIVPQVITPVPQVVMPYVAESPARGPYGDRDRDGIPNQYDRDKDGDGVPNRFDDRPNNPYRQ